VSFDVSTADIESRWRTLSDDESDVALVRLADADRDLRGQRPLLEAFFVALPDTDRKADLLETIRAAEADAVIRFLKNPDLVSQQNIGADGSIGIGFDTRTVGGVYISAADLMKIDAAVGAANGALRRHVGSQQLVSTWPWRSTTNSLPTP
jgi:hypothetical protein